MGYNPPTVWEPALAEESLTVSFNYEAAIPWLLLILEPAWKVANLLGYRTVQ